MSETYLVVDCTNGAIIKVFREFRDAVYFKNCECTQASAEDYQIIKSSEYLEHLEKFFTSIDSIKEIKENDFDYAFEVLPPKVIDSSSDNNTISFILLEATITGEVFDMFIKYKNRFFKKPVFLNKTNTYFTKEILNKFIKENK